MALVEIKCAVCGTLFPRKPYEVRRNERMGRVNLCGHSCQATWMNMSAAKQAQTKAMLAARNAHQYRDANANWRGGSRHTSHPLKPVPAALCPRCGASVPCLDARAVRPVYRCEICAHNFECTPAAEG